MSRLLGVLLVLFVVASVDAADPDRAGLEFFENKIRPVLVNHCYECHSATAAEEQNVQGGLLLDSREGSLRGGESGPAVVPGNPDESLLIGALKHESFKMPPDAKLPKPIVADFVKWIEMGAPDPREGDTALASLEIDIEAGKEHWSFQPLKRPSTPRVLDQAWVRTPVDQFVRARQETAGVSPNAIAEPRKLARRAYFNLIGLPPEPEEVEQFVQEAKADFDGAYQRLIDRLLDSEHYGERWARHWLDITRFAESNGYAFDGDRPNAWHYRDFVIRAFNADLPYDEFVRLQLAGDLLTDTNVKSSEEAQLALNTIAATGFLVAGPYTTQQTQKERERSRYEQLDDIVNTIGTALLGLTVGCSRCHSHKFDPLPQDDYYQLASCFAEVGFSNTGINTKPESFAKRQQTFAADHQPLVAARTAYEKENLPDVFEAWRAHEAKQVLATGEVIALDDWHYAGPFAGESFEAAFNEAYGPEAGVDLTAAFNDGALKWTHQPSWKDGAVHNPFTGDNTAHYIYRTFESPVDQALSLSLGSDDGIKVWVNDKLVLAKLVGRGAAPGQEIVQVPISRGTNQLLMKIVNGGGLSGFYFAGTPIVPRDLPTLGPWYHVGPFAAANFDAAFAQAFPPETDTDLDRTFKNGELKWTAQPDWHDAEAHNDKLKGTNCANYLYRIIESAEPQVLQLSLGSDDGIKLWVNGRELLANRVGRNVASAGQENVAIPIAAGRNELLMKIVNGGGASGFYFASSPSQTPDELAEILKQAPDQWSEEQKNKLVEWHHGFDIHWLRLNQVVIRHEIHRPKPEMTQVFAARKRGTTYQFGDDTYKVYHLRRGNADNKEAPAEPGFLQVLTSNEHASTQWLADPHDPNQSRASRLAVADWLTDADQGAGHLLARVIVNRIWHYHFGRGIVATPSDFGTRGEKPSHPLLLDWLATELIRSDWKLKPIHKLILTSATFMQAGEITESGREHDPENLLLWRRNARRLEAEVIRDSLLSVSGALDSSMFGQGTLDVSSTRRSIYFTVKRSQLIRMLQLFDAPGTMQGIGAREESTVAPQALTLLNSPIIQDFATKLARRVSSTTDASIEELINRAYRIALARSATSEELLAMTAFIDQQQASRGSEEAARQDTLRDFCHLLLCTNEFVYID